jgi:hypothetical protein
MIFQNWRDFFKCDEGCYDLDEERYQAFKARLLSEVVAKETITQFGEVIGEKIYILGNKE